MNKVNKKKQKQKHKAQNNKTINTQINKITTTTK
jgi:hypothetical protein